ncbi:MAG: hypothetical protein OXG81_13055 [Acidobacteria bacterium]|nr:hypothetical protein [Acidobacteriota bacterium]
MRLHEGAAGGRCRGLPLAACVRSDAGDRFLDFVELLQHPRRGHLEPGPVGLLESGLRQAAEQILAAAHEIGSPQLERGRPRGHLAREEGEPEAQTGEDGGDEGNRRNDSQVSVSPLSPSASSSRSTCLR